MIGFFKHILFVMVLAAVFTGPQGQAAARVLESTCPIDPPLRAVGNTVPRFQAPRFLADNRPVETPEKDMPENARKETRSVSKPKAEASSGKMQKPGLKPFVPSEKIEADQVVDFPYDI